MVYDNQHLDTDAHFVDIGKMAMTSDYYLMAA
jgi:hypothetical protein